MPDKPDKPINELERRRLELGWSVRKIALIYAKKLGKPNSTTYLGTVQKIFDDPDHVVSWRKDLIIEIMGGTTGLLWIPADKLQDTTDKNT
jgi:hypothetical protein